MRKQEVDPLTQTDRQQTLESLLLSKEAVAQASDTGGMSTPDGKHHDQNEAFDELVGSIRETHPKTLFLESVLDAIPDVIGLQDLSHTMIRYNAAGLEMLGQTPEEVAGKKCYELIGHKAPCDICATRETYQTKRPARVEKFVAELGLWLDVRSYPVFNTNGELQWVIEHLRDITNRKHAEEELREAAIKWQTTFDVMENVVWLLDKDMRIMAANQATQIVFGTSPQAASGRNCWEFVHGTQKPIAECPVMRARETLRRESMELQVGDQWYDVIVDPIIGDAQALIGFIHVVSNITQRKNQEKEQQAFEVRIRQTQRLESMGVLAGGIAHDFNNILMAIMGNADLAFNELSPLSPARENLAQIVSSSKRAAELCAQMLSYAGKSRVERRNMCLRTLIEETLDMLKTSISKKAILKLNLEKELPCIHGDPSQIRQILMNLVINASEAIGERSGVITISTGAIDCSEQYLSTGYILAPATQGTYVYIEVSDTGCGMDKDTVQHIFEPFYTTKFIGRGLGLSAIMGIIRAHEGALRVYSEPGKGSMFKVLFPTIEVAEDIKPDGDGSVLWLGSGTILLVDDEESIRAISSEQLRHLGFEVLTAEDGRKAVDLFRERWAEIDLVLLDLTMPDMNGEEAYGELRQIDPNVRVILASGYSENDIAPRFAGKGLGGYLQKPYPLATLRSLLSTLLPHANPTSSS